MPGSVPVGAWIYSAGGDIRRDATDWLARRTVVLLGEEHDRAEHHRWQLDTIAALHDRRRDLALGFEMFPRRVQPALDRWTTGQSSEDAFLAESDWARVWGMDAGLYLPLFRFARAHGLPMLALNVDRATIRLIVSRGLAALTHEEREGVGDPATAPASYRERLTGVFAMHPAAAAGPDLQRFERFVTAQQFWDRAMAEAIAGARRQDPPPLVIGIMGRGHIEYGDGVPHQLAALGVDAVATALPWPAGTGYPGGIADLLYGIAPDPDSA